MRDVESSALPPPPDGLPRFQVQRDQPDPLLAADAVVQTAGTLVDLIAKAMGWIWATIAALFDLG